MPHVHLTASLILIIILSLATAPRQFQRYGVTDELCIVSHFSEGRCLQEQMKSHMLWPYALRCTCIFWTRI